MNDWYHARHTALFFWTAVFLLYSFLSSRQVRKSFLGLLRTTINPTILTLLGGLALVVLALATVAVILGRIGGFWETLPVVTVSTWTVTSGLGLMMNLNNFLEKGGEFKKASAVLTPAAIVAALTNIAVLSIWLELGLLPLLACLSFAVAYYESKRHSHRPYKAAIAILTCYTLLLVSLAVKTLIEDPTTWKSLAQGALLPAWLTIGALPYLRLLIAAERWRFTFRCPSRTVSSVGYGSDWPLTVESAKLCCKHRAVWVEVDGKKYGVNGTSKGILSRWGYNCFDLSEIWRDAPQGDGTKVSIHRLIQDGLALEAS